MGDGSRRVARQQPTTPPMPRPPRRPQSVTAPDKPQAPVTPTPLYGVARHMNARDLVRPAAAETEYDTEPASYLTAWKTLVLVVAGLSLVLLPGVAALLIIRDDAGGAAADARDPQPDPSASAAFESTTTNPDASSTTASTTTAPTTTTEAAPAGSPGTASPTSAPPTTPTPTTAPTTTTGPPTPVVDSFDVDIDQGCGRGSSIARFSWATSQATTVTLGHADGSSEQVPADGQASTCVDDDGETWRLTAAGSGGTTTRDLRIDP
ncbi:MAG: hypothetical protein ACRD2C_05885 [Acidimicrobiales bacterium]